MEGEMVALHFRIDPPQMRVILAKGGEIHLAGQCGVNRDGPQSGPGLEPITQSSARGRRVAGVIL